MRPWAVSYGETLTWTLSPTITLILFFFIRPERTPVTLIPLSHSISILPPPSIRVTRPSKCIKSSLLNSPSRASCHKPCEKINNQYATKCLLCQRITGTILKSRKPGRCCWLMRQKSRGIADLSFPFWPIIEVCV
jgi:hypothetical protein